MVPNLGLMPTCDPIGRIETPFADPSDAPSQGEHTGAEGVLRIDPTYRAAMDGIDSGDHIDVLWFGHRADRTVLRYPDREIGVFSLRTMDRPNPIGVTPCVVTGRDGTELTVRGVDMVDGTPLLDVKPTLEHDR